MKLSRSRSFQSCFIRICLFGSFLFKGKKSILQRYLNLNFDLNDSVDQSEVDCSGLSDTLENDEDPQHQYQYN